MIFFIVLLFQDPDFKHNFFLNPNLSKTTYLKLKIFREETNY